MCGIRCEGTRIKIVLYSDSDRMVRQNLSRSE
jgi:hypothetical protein